MTQRLACPAFWRYAFLAALVSGALVGCGGGSPSSGADATADAGAASGSTAAGAEGPPPGKETYERFCVSCHAVGAGGAPRLGDTAAWAPRIAKGTDAMVATVTTGMTAMPPKGGCLNCSEPELRASVEYMVALSK